MMTIGGITGTDLSSASGSDNQSPVSRAENTANGWGATGGTSSSRPVRVEKAQHKLQIVLHQVACKKELFATSQQLQHDDTLLEDDEDNLHINHHSNALCNDNNNDSRVINLFSPLTEKISARDVNNSAMGKIFEKNPHTDAEPIDLTETQHSTEVSSNLNPAPLTPPRGSPQLVDVSKAATTPVKRARVENIVSSMRSSLLLAPVNGCKKRKLYHPQQHNNRHTTSTERHPLSDHQDDLLSPVYMRDDEQDQKDILKNKLKLMQQQLVQIQQEYLPLYINDMAELQNSSDSDTHPQDHDISLPYSPPAHLLPPQIPHMVATAVGPKFPPSTTVLNVTPPPFPITAHHNAALYHKFQNQPRPQPPPSFVNPHTALSNATAMYFTEQEAVATADRHHPYLNAQVKPPSFVICSKKPLSYQSPKTKSSDLLQPVNFNSSISQQTFDLNGLTAALKSEINTSMTALINLIDRFVLTKRDGGRSIETSAAEQLSKDLLLASQLLDRKSPSTTVIDHVSQYRTTPTKAAPPYASSAAENNINAINLQGDGGGRSRGTEWFSPCKMISKNLHFNSTSTEVGIPPDPSNLTEQNEALSLVVASKRKRHKVTDSRITPRTTASRVLSQDCTPAPNLIDSPSKYVTNCPESSPPQPRSLQVTPPPPMLPVSLPASVAIPNPHLQESQVLSPYCPLYRHHLTTPYQLMTSSSPLGTQSSPLFHPAFFATTQHHQQKLLNSPLDYMKSGSVLAADDHESECTSLEYDGMTSTLSTLSPMHLRKAKLMFFWVRYPSSAVLKMYFPDINFKKNNTAQLVKWFSNFREFYYIQMEKYARDVIADGITNAADLHVTTDCDIYRILNIHYNRNNHIETPSSFRYVIEETLKEFFKAIQRGEDQKHSWKKPIYKVISRLDETVPEYFKLPNFLEQLES